MAAEAARALDYTNYEYYGSAAPARAPYFEPQAEPLEAPVPGGQTRTGVRAREVAAQKTVTVSLFAIFGTVFVGVLLFFVVLAHISYSELTSETVRLNEQLEELTEQERRLEIMFESAIDMKEVERYARDTLGMSKPSAEQVVIVYGQTVDTAEIIDSGGGTKEQGSFAAFLSSLLDYLR